MMARSDGVARPGRSGADGPGRHVRRHGKRGRSCLSIACRTPASSSLYPEGRVSPTQEAQLTMFNSEEGNVRACAVAGSFDDCHRLTREGLQQGRVEAARASDFRPTRSTSDVCCRRWFMYFHAVARARDLIAASEAVPRMLAPPEIGHLHAERQFRNTSTGLMAQRAGLPISRFVAATNGHDVVPAIPDVGPLPSHARRSTRSCQRHGRGNPSNFERMLWLSRRRPRAMRRWISRASRHDDESGRETIKRVRDSWIPALDPHECDCLHGAQEISRGRKGGKIRRGGTRIGIFLASSPGGSSGRSWSQSSDDRS